ncbi:MAG: hypothetical protein RBS68_02480 [Anaerolineales bacterium]|jgi:hypothetical protein|nr:hypothetical protein [Anaerolineales bacterium]
MANKKPGTKSNKNKPEKKESQSGLVAYRVIFIVISLILLLSLVLSSIRF